MWATRVAAAQEGPNEAKRRALAASSAGDASVVSDADMADHEQLGREASVVDKFSNVSDILRCDHDDAGCKRSERGQVRESRGTMRGTTLKRRCTRYRGQDVVLA